MAAPHEDYDLGDEIDLKAERRKCTCGRVCFWLLWAALLFTLIVGALALVLYFVYQPQAPSFDIAHFEVQNLTVSAAFGDRVGFFLDGVANYTLAGYNPNKGTIYYNFINITVLFNGQPFGNSSIPPFNQKPESVSTLNSSLIIDKYPLTLEIGPAFLSMYNTHVLPFSVVSVAGAHLNILGITSPTVTVQMSCNVTVNLTTSSPISKVCSSAQIPLPSVS